MGYGLLHLPSEGRKSMLTGPELRVRVRMLGFKLSVECQSLPLAAVVENDYIEPNPNPILSPSTLSNLTRASRLTLHLRVLLGN